MVDKNVRGKGIGKQLLQAAEKYATDQGGINIELTSSNYRKKDGTHAFYESFGYQSHLGLDCTFFSKTIKRAESVSTQNSAAGERINP